MEKLCADLYVGSDQIDQAPDNYESRSDNISAIIERAVPWRGAVTANDSQLNSCRLPAGYQALNFDRWHRRAGGAIGRY
jgi:hypothetical protein